MPDAVIEAPKSYQCRHLFADGHRCAAKSLRAEPFCFYHHTTRRPISSSMPKAAPATPAETAFDLPFPEDRQSIQLAIGDILRRIAQNQLDPRRAGLLLYGLQIASSNLPKPKSDPREDPEEPVEEVESHPDLGPLAPAAEYVPYKEKPSFLSALFPEFNLDDEEDEEDEDEEDEEDESNNPPSTRTTGPIPTLQACAPGGQQHPSTHPRSSVRRPPQSEAMTIPPYPRPANGSGCCGRMEARRRRCIISSNDCLGSGPIVEALRGGPPSSSPVAMPTRLSSTRHRSTSLHGMPTIGIPCGKDQSSAIFWNAPDNSRVADDSRRKR